MPSGMHYLSNTRSLKKDEHPLLISWGQSAGGAAWSPSHLELSFHIGEHSKMVNLVGEAHGQEHGITPLTRLFRPTLLALLRGVMSAPRLDFLACPGPGAAGASACSSAVSSREASLQGSSLTFGVDPMSCFMRASICRRAAAMTLCTGVSSAHHKHGHACSITTYRL